MFCAKRGSYLTYPVKMMESFGGIWLKILHMWRYKTPSLTCLTRFPLMTTSDRLSPVAMLWRQLFVFSLDPTTNTHTAKHWLMDPVWEPSPLTLRSPALHTIVACFTSRWLVMGDAAVTPIKVQGGSSITPGHFCLLVKIIKYLRRGQTL